MVCGVCGVCVCWCVCWCVWWWGVCGVCVLVVCVLVCVVCRFKAPPCVPAKRPCHTRHGRFGGTHGDVLNLHTEAFWIYTRTHNMNTNTEHEQNTDTTPYHTQHFRQNRDNVDCRHIDHLALHKVQATQLVKNIKAHNSQFWLCDEQHWLQSNITAVCPLLFKKSHHFDIRSTAQKITLCQQHLTPSQKQKTHKTETKKRCPRAISNVPWIVKSASTRSHVYAGFQQKNKTRSVIMKKLRRWFFSITVSINSKNKSRIKLRILMFFLIQKRKICNCNHFTEMVFLRRKKAWHG